MIANVSNHRTATPADWLVTLIGLWVIISPFVLGYGGNTMTMLSNIAVGIPIALVALESGLLNDILEPLLVPLGIWLFISAFILGRTGVGLFWSNVVLAFFVVGLGPISAGLRQASQGQSPTT